MELKHGITVEKNGEQKNLKEFEVLPLNAGVILDAAANGGDEKIELTVFAKRIKIKGLDGKNWNAGLLKKMSVEDYSIMQNAVEEFDRVFIFTPPVVKE